MTNRNAAMDTYIILLRGVMPTGRNRVPMAPLREALEAAGLANVRTWIQSGNVIASADLGQAAVETLVHDVIEQEFGGDIAVLARTADYFKRALTSVPFKKADPAKLYLTLLARAPEPDLLQAFLAPGYKPDRIEVVNDIAYILCATRYSDLKINNNFIERKLKIAATTRISNTIAKLVAMSSSSA